MAPAVLGGGGGAWLEEPNTDEKRIRESFIQPEQGCVKYPNDQGFQRPRGFSVFLCTQKCHFKKESKSGINQENWSLQGEATQQWREVDYSLES